MISEKFLWSVACGIVGATFPSSTIQACEKFVTTGDNWMPTPLQTVTDFCAAFSENHAEGAIRRWFTPATVWINTGLSLTTGIEEAINRPRSPNVSAVHFDMLVIAADGNLVLTERLDRFIREDGSEVAALKVMGIFEVEGDHIVGWRDYFDVNRAGEISSV